MNSQQEELGRKKINSGGGREEGKRRREGREGREERKSERQFDVDSFAIFFFFFFIFFHFYFYFSSIYLSFFFRRWKI